MAKLAWIGLGVMGFPMAGHVAGRGDHEICVYNRTPEKAQNWISLHGGTAASTPEQAARDADYIFCCVGNDDDVREVTLGAKGAFQSLKKGAIFIDHTTTSALLARELDQKAKDREALFFDAPVSGGEMGAQNGKLTVMVGGTKSLFSKIKTLIEAYSVACRLMGPAGSGQLTKMVNQIAIAGLLQSLSEAIHFAEKSGLDVAQVMDVISKGAAQSWQMENRWQTMTAREFDFGFAVDWMRKDLAICLAEAARNDAKLPVAELVDQFYKEVQQTGGNRYDTSSLITRLKP